MLTRPAKKNFDWPLYEAGLFEDISGSQYRRAICLHPVGETPPPQLAKRQATRATKENILDLLGRLYREPEFSGTRTPLNSKVKDAQLKPMVEAIYEEINGLTSDELKRLEYGNHWIQIVLQQGQMALAPDVEICSSPRSLRNLFDLPPKPAKAGAWTWADIEKRTTLSNDPKGFNTHWIAELREEIAARRDPDCQRADRQLTGRYLGKDGQLYRPEIEICREYKNDRMTIDVTFSRQVQDEWLSNAGAPVALASMISLASRIRHELIEGYLQRLRSWSGEEEIRDGFARLRTLDEVIEGDGFFINRLTKESLGQAFAGHRDEAKVLAELHGKFTSEIRPTLAAALDGLDVDKAEQALEAWKENNERFLEIGLKVYADLLGLSKAA